MSLKDQVIVVTGGTGGLGRAVVRACLQAEAHVVVTHRRPVQRETFAADFGPDAARLRLEPADLTNEAQVDALADAVLRNYGKLDGWLNLVGGYAGGTPVTSLSLADFEAMFTLNVRTAFLGGRAALRAMQPRRCGAVVNVSSLGALRGTAGHAGYAAAKAAVIRLTETMAAEAAPYGVRVNVVLPGMIDTPANRAAMPDADRTSWVAPEAVAAVIVFLLSDAARGLNGAALPVGG